MTYPLAFRAGEALIRTDVNALNDSYLSVWIFGWQAHQLLRNPLYLFHGNIFYPFSNTLAFSEIIFPEALMYLPLELASGNPILAYNLVVLGLFALNGWAAYLWALDWLHLYSGEPSGLRQNGAALLAGLVFAFCNYKLGEIRHVQLLAAQWMPLTLLYLGRGLRRPTARNAFLTALFYTLNALSSLYYGVFLTLAAALYVGVDFLVRRYRLTRAHLTFALVAALTAAVILTPFLIPFVQFERQYKFSATRDPRAFSARPAGYLASLETNWLYGKTTQAWYDASKGQPLFPGLLVLVLAGVGFVTRRWRAVIFLGLLAAMAFVLSFGPRLLLARDINTAFPHALPYYWLALVVTPLNSLNAPARFDVLVMLALALLVALGANRLVARRGGGALLAAFGAVILLEYAAVPLPLKTVPVGASLSPVYAYLAAQPPDQPVVEVPMGQANLGSQDQYVVYTYSSIYHWQPLVNGFSTFIPKQYYSLVRIMTTFPSANALEHLKNWGAVFVVVHSDQLPNAPKARAKLADLPGIEHVQDFGAVWLYRIK